MLFNKQLALGNMNHALSDMVLAHRTVSVAARLYREKCRNSNAALLFWLRMADTSNINNVTFFCSGGGDWRFILSRQDIQAKAGNRFIQKKISHAG